MTQFLRLLADTDKALALTDACSRMRMGKPDDRYFEVQPSAFGDLPGKPFAYWISKALRSAFHRLPAFENAGRTAKQGLATADDFRFVRAWWEVGAAGAASKWLPFAKGGAYSPFYSDVYLAANWVGAGAEMDAFAGSVIRNADFYMRPGLTWPRRTKSRLSMRLLPGGCVFADKGPAVFVDGDDTTDLLALLAVCASVAFHKLVECQLAAADARPGGAAHSFEVGVIQTTPVPPLDDEYKNALAELSRRAWSIKRRLDSVHEVSHAFLLPTALRKRLGEYAPESMNAELDQIQAEIESRCFGLYGLGDSERQMPVTTPAADMPGNDGEDEDDEADTEGAADERSQLLSWAVGVAFGHFDWRLATGERFVPPEPDPLAPLPSRSPGMLAEGARPFHMHDGILVDDQGHQHDLPRIAEEVLVRVNVHVPDDLRRWLRREFFPLHLRRYSKSRRKAPIYWPLSTGSGSYTLWVYYPDITSQTLYTAVNDFVEPKLRQVGSNVAVLRNKGAARTRDDERQFEAVQALELELIELRESLLNLAPTYKPNHDDGAQISAAPLWLLLRHKPWQNLLKDTWAKLERGDYDWARLAMNYWPDRVREQCRTDKSLAIAHGLESLYVETDAAPKKARGRKKGAEE